MALLVGGSLTAMKYLPELPAEFGAQAFAFNLRDRATASSPAVTLAKVQGLRRGLFAP